MMQPDAVLAGLGGDTAELLLAVVEHLPDAVTLATAVRDEHGRAVDMRLVYMNAKARSGQPDAEEAVGGLCSELWPGMVDNGSLHACMRVLDTGEPASGSFDWVDEETYQPAGYDYRAVRVGADTLVWVLRDNTDAVRAAAALAQSQEQQRTILDTLTEGVLLQDASGVVLDANESAARILRVPRDEVVGHRPEEWTTVFVDTEGAPLEPIDTPRGVALTTGRPRVGALLGIRYDDDPVRWLLVNSQPLFRTGARRPYATVTSFQDITAAYAQHESATIAADRDGLTGAANRRVLLEELAQAVRAPSELAVLFVDVDHFKSINDKLGHAAGDDVLRAVAERLKGAVRETDLVARLGGDEFVLVCRDVTPAAVRALEARIQRLMSLPLTVRGAHGRAQVRVSVSIGVAFRDPGQTAAEVLGAADESMYDAKRSRVDAR